MLRPSVGGKRRVVVQGETVGEVLGHLCVNWPELRATVFSCDGALAPYLNVYLNGEDLRATGGLSSAVASGDSLQILPALSGGS